MKRKLALILIFLIVGASTNLFAQHQQDGGILGYKGGDSAFMKFLHNNTRFPAKARDIDGGQLKPETAVFIVLEIDKEGKIDSIRLLYNHSSEMLLYMPDIEKTLNLTKGKWMARNKSRVIIIPFIFYIIAKDLVWKNGSTAFFGKSWLKNKSGSYYKKMDKEIVEGILLPPLYIVGYRSKGVTDAYHIKVIN